VVQPGRVGRDVDPVALQRHRAFGQRPVQADMLERDAWQALVPEALHRADHRARHRREELRHLADDDLADLSAVQDLRELVGEQVDDDQRLGTAVAELVFHFGRGIERIGVHQHATRLHDPEGHHRIGRAIGRLHRHPRPLRQAKHVAQVHGEGIRVPVDLRVTERTVHAVGHAGGEGGLRGKAGRRVAHQFGQVLEARHRRVGVDVAAVLLHPRLQVVQGSGVIHVEVPPGRADRSRQSGTIRKAPSRGARVARFSSVPAACRYKGFPL